MVEKSLLWQNLILCGSVGRLKKTSMSGRHCAKPIYVGITDLNQSEKVLAFKVGDRHFPAHFVNSVTGREVAVTEQDWEAIITRIK